MTPHIHLSVTLTVSQILLTYATTGQLYQGASTVAEASRFCRAFAEVRQFFRVRTTMKQQVSLAQQREVFPHQLDALKAMMLVAYHPEESGREVSNTFS